MKLAIIFGSSSNEHDVSVVSAASIIKNLDKDKYKITPIYLDSNNKFYLWKEDIKKIKPLTIGILPTNLEPIKEPFSYLKTFDCVFMMIHGKNGEDGILSSILEFEKIPYVGNKPRASMITMDKILTKDLLERNGIKTAKYISFMKYNDEYILKGESYSLKEVLNKIKSEMNFPLFIKPANSGSSIGVSKVTNSEELKTGILNALEIDNRILVEEGIIGKELECGILEENKMISASVIGEIKPAEEFYSFDAKYKNVESKTIIPANISKSDRDEIRKTAIKAFKILDLHGFSRIDFFLTENHEIILNEINAIPGFTEISMYPKLWEESGIPYSELLDTLINESIKK